MSDSIWNKKGATFSDKTARNEFSLTQEEIIEAIKDGKLQYRTNYMHGNPYFRLLRNEVEVLVTEKYGKAYLENKTLEHELAQINRQLRRLKKEMASLENRKVELLSLIRG